MFKRRNFRDQVVLVTGAGDGIGAALTRELANLGATVWATDCEASRAEAVAEGLSGVRAAVLDVSDAEQFSRRVDEIIAEHGRLDVLINNAGIGVTGEVRDLPLEAWNRVVDVNLRGVIHGIHAVYPRMVEQGSGHISNMACIAGLVPFPMTAAYCATKHAVVAMSTALRAEASELGVEVSVICPGTIDTGMFDSIEYFGVDKQVIKKGIRPVLMPAERCAQAILRGVARNRAIIPVTLHARLTWLFYRLMPQTFLAVTARGFRAFRERLRGESPNS